MLVEKMVEVATEHGYRGIYAVAQDNNLAACKFYLKNGFVIGGFVSVAMPPYAPLEAFRFVS